VAGLAAGSAAAGLAAGNDHSACPQLATIGRYSPEDMAELGLALKILMRLPDPRLESLQWLNQWHNFD